MRRASSPQELGFTASDKAELSRALKEAVCAREFRRVQAILLVAKGRHVTDAARVTGLCQSTIYNLVDRYLENHSVSSLPDRDRSGRPPVAAAITEDRILKELKRSPLQLGYRTNVWTVDLLAYHINERYHSDISPRTLRRRMRAMGLRYKRPRYVYSEKEAHLPQKKGRLSAS